MRPSSVATVGRDTKAATIRVAPTTLVSSMVTAKETAVAEGTAAEDGDGAIRSYPDGHLFWVAFPISAPFVLCLLRFRVSRRPYSPYVLEEKYPEVYTAPVRQLGVFSERDRLPGRCALEPRPAILVA